MADGFRACGGSVFISDLDAAALAASGHVGMIADAGEAAAMENFVDAALAHLGGLDVLINNAGIAGPTAPVEDVTPAELEETLRVDLAAMFHCSRRAVQALRAAGGGSIVNLSSAAGRFGFALRSPYAAAKWGVIGFTKSLAIELGPDCIRVNAILPGLVAGDRQRRVLESKAQQRGVSYAEMETLAFSFTSIKDYVTPEQIAAQILFLTSPWGRTISGQAIQICGNTQMLS